MVVDTLRAMAKGGMNDQLGGGFHRYSVDANWFVPHFEKMLYDQAQLAISYLEAFQITGDRTLAETAREIFDYVLRDMLRRRGRLLFGRGCRQRDRSGPSARKRRRRVLHLDAGGDREAARAASGAGISAISSASKRDGNVRGRSAQGVHRQEHFVPGAFDRGDGRSISKSRSEMRRRSRRREASCWRSDRSGCGRISTTKC